jgi:hypothetical protein
VSNRNLANFFGNEIILAGFAVGFGERIAAVIMVAAALVTSAVWIGYRRRTAHR